MGRELDNLIEETTSVVVADLKGTIRRLQKKLSAEQDRSEALNKAIYDAVHDGLVTLEPRAYVAPTRDQRRKSDETAILMISDLQLGKRTETYNTEVAAERISLLCQKAQKIVDIQRADHPVKKLALFLLGDIVEGELIFPGQEWEIDSSLFEQIFNAVGIIEGVCIWAAGQFEEVEVWAVPGNHGYLGGRSRKNYSPQSNADRIVYRISELVTSKSIPNVSWNVTLDWFQIANLGPRSRFFLCHGDNVRSYQGIPWYGWQRAVQGLSMMNKIWAIEFDYLAAGHFHTPVSIYINGIRYWINASTESHNPYALRQLNAAGQPAQWLLFSKPDQGVTAEYLISLDT